MGASKLSVEILSWSVNAPNQPPMFVPVKCGNNAYCLNDGSCACYEGYTGNAYLGCQYDMCSDKVCDNGEICNPTMANASVVKAMSTKMEFVCLHCIQSIQCMLQKINTDMLWAILVRRFMEWKTIQLILIMNMWSLHLAHQDHAMRCT